MLPGAGWSAQAKADGGFGFGTRGGGSDVDDTAAALQAVVDADVRTGSVVTRAAAFLLHAQNLDGGYPQEQGGESNAQSTAWAIQGLLAAGRNVNAVRREGSRSPLGYLESLIAPDGSVRYSRTGAQTPVWVTAQALTALAGKPFPIARRGAIGIDRTRADTPVSPLERSLSLQPLLSARHTLLEACRDTNTPLRPRPSGKWLAAHARRAPRVRSAQPGCASSPWR